MRTELTIFDTFSNSKVGLYRGFVLFACFIAIILVYFLITKKRLYDSHIDKVSKDRVWIPMFIAGVLIVSAISVNTPTSVKGAILYGSLVGLVVYGITNASMISQSKKWGYGIAIIDTIAGIVTGCILSLILYYLVTRHQDVFGYDK